MWPAQKSETSSLNSIKVQCTRAERQALCKLICQFPDIQQILSYDIENNLAMINFLLDFLLGCLNLVSPLIAIILFSAFVICLLTQPGGTIAITIVLIAIVVLFQACQAFNENAAVSAQNKNEVKYNKLAQNLDHANYELSQYADSLGLRPGVCTSYPRYGIMVPCSIALRDGSGPTEQIFCPWRTDYHGCTISLDPEKNPKSLFNAPLKISASAKSDSQGEAYNNNLSNPVIGNFANKVFEAIDKIQELLEGFDKIKPAATEIEKIEYVSNETTPNFKRRAAKALLAGGDRAIEEFLDNPYLNIAKSIIHGWMDSPA